MRFIKYFSFVRFEKMNKLNNKYDLFQLLLLEIKNRITFIRFIYCNQGTASIYLSVFLRDLPSIDEVPARSKSSNRSSMTFPLCFA